MSDGLLTLMVVMELAGIAALVAWFIVVWRRGYFERADQAIRAFLERHGRQGPRR